MLIKSEMPACLRAVKLVVKCVLMRRRGRAMLIKSEMHAGLRAVKLAVKLIVVKLVVTVLVKLVARSKVVLRRR